MAPSSDSSKEHNTENGKGVTIIMMSLLTTFFVYIRLYDTLNGLAAYKEGW
jgi:hypothetical protein